MGLAKYYKENKLPVLLGVKQGPDFKRSEDAAPEFEFSGKGKRSGESKGIVSLMNMLIEDLEDELIEKKVNLIDTIARREEEKTDEHEDMSVNHGDKADELNYKAEIRPDCDWIIRSFTDRHNAREAEMNGLTTAKEYLAGAKVPSLIQQSKFNDDALTGIRFLGLKK